MTNTNNWIRSVLIVLTIFGCVNTITFDVPDPSQTLVVDGLITDQPGPYSVKLTYATNVNNFIGYASPAIGASVIIFDDAGNSETLRDLGNGKYQTKSSGIQGQAGRQYHIEIQTQDGKKYQSQPELLSPVANFDSLYFEFHHEQHIVEGQPISADGFYVYANATGFPNQQNFLRWTWKGTFKIFTHPELVIDPFTRCDAPLECSGYIASGCHSIEKIRDLCTCCTCWAKQYQASPAVSDDQFLSDGKFTHINIAYIPSNQIIGTTGVILGTGQFTGLSFFDKYLVEVQQMSLSQSSHEFWKLVSQQKSSAASLFQPPAAIVRGNMISTDDQPVLGVFSASAVTKKSIYIPRGAIPEEYRYPDYSFDFSCQSLDSTSTTTQPSYWIDD